MSRTGGRAAEPQAEAGGSFAQRMMEKMGWKEGLGLGKAHQGITTPLMAQKTDTRSGIIVNAQVRRPDATDMPPEKKTRGVAIRGTPTRVILLRNIVGPGTNDSLAWTEWHDDSHWPCVSMCTAETYGHLDLQVKLMTPWRTRLGRNAANTGRSPRFSSSKSRSQAFLRTRLCASLWSLRGWNLRRRR